MMSIKSNEAYIEIAYYKSPVGELLLGTYQGELCICDWKYRRMRSTIDKRVQKGLQAKYKESNNVIIEETILQLTQYFNQERKDFTIPLRLVGTDFQQTVWRHLIEIPFGKTESYLGLSRRLENEKAIRAVASANGANAISIIVPCHRIIGSNGSLVGYAGGLPAKKRLLALEKAFDVVQLELF